MNNRIEELAKQSGLAVKEDDGRGLTRTRYPDGYEKFAELIALECIMLCVQEARRLTDTMPTPTRGNFVTVAEHNGMLTATVDMVEKIIAHFGVKQ